MAYVLRNVEKFLRDNPGCLEKHEEALRIAANIAEKNNGTLVDIEVLQILEYDQRIFGKFQRDVMDDPEHQRFFAEDTGVSSTSGNRGGQGIQTHPETLPQEHPTDTGQKHPES